MKLKDGSHPVALSYLYRVHPQNRMVTMEKEHPTEPYVLLKYTDHYGKERELWFDKDDLEHSVEPMEEPEFTLEELELASALVPTPPR